MLRHAAWTSFAEGNRRMAEVNAKLGTPEARKDIRILKMKALIHSWCKGYNPQDHGFWPGPGMSFGDKTPSDTYAKLANDLWTCTSHALPHVAKQQEQQQQIQAQQQIAQMQNEQKQAELQLKDQMNQRDNDTKLSIS